MKLFKKLMMLFPLMALTACGSVQVALAQDTPIAPEPTPTVSENTTYLVLGKYGLYNGEKGVSVETVNDGDKVLSIYSENTYIYTAEKGSALPGADVVTSSVKDVKFVSWMAYENQGKPTIYDKVPEVNHKILYAFFEYTGDYGPEVKPNPDPDVPPVGEAVWYITGQGSFVNGQNWEPTSGIALEINPKPIDPKWTEYMKLNVHFEVGDIFKVAKADKSEWVQTFKTDAGSAFADGLMEKVNDGNNGSNAKVKVAGNYDFYLSFDANKTPSIWIQAHK